MSTGKMAVCRPLKLFDFVNASNAAAAGSSAGAREKQDKARRGSSGNLDFMDATSTTTASSCSCYDESMTTPAESPSGSQTPSSASSQPVSKSLTGLTLLNRVACSALQFSDFYKLDEKIARGSFGTVYTASHVSTGEEYAVKVLERKKLTEREKLSVIREVSILRDCADVPHLVRLVDFFASPTHFYVVQVYAQGGDLFSRLASSTSYSENDARDVARHLLRAIQVLHSRRIAHRDLKPENLLLENLYDDTSILIADFGFARYVPREGLTTRCGTPAFVAPEVLGPNCRYNEMIDMWSVGCLLYMLIGGYPPFQDTTHRGLFRKIRAADFCFHEANWKSVTVQAKQLIASLLVVDPQYRCTAEKALTSPWFQISPHILRKHNLSASLGEIKLFNARRQLKGAIHAVMLMVRYSNHRSETDMDWTGHGQREGRRLFSPQGYDILVTPCYKSDNTVLGKSTALPSFRDVYELNEKIQGLHRGLELWECYHKYTREIFAVKIIPRCIEAKEKTANGRSVTDAVVHEAAILDSLKHKNIIRYVDFFEEQDSFYLITERMYGGDLFDQILHRKQYTEQDARELARSLLEAVDYLHEQRIAHRDLKPQNLMLKTSDDEADIKIADFGFACRVHTPQSLTTRCGTPTYVAPEILKNCPYDQKADMWSVGVILYVLLCGYPPFVDENQGVLFQKIRSGEWSFNERHWSSISKEAKHLIQKLLVVNPTQRWTAKKCLGSAWFKLDFCSGEDPINETSRDLGIKSEGSGEAICCQSGRLWSSTHVEPPPSTSMDAVEMRVEASNGTTALSNPGVQTLPVAQGFQCHRFSI